MKLLEEYHQRLELANGVIEKDSFRTQNRICVLYYLHDYTCS